MLSHFSRVQLCATPQTAAHQAPLSLEFSRQEHWSGGPLPPPTPLLRRFHVFARSCVAFRCAASWPHCELQVGRASVLSLLLCPVPGLTPNTFQGLHRAWRILNLAGVWDKPLHLSDGLCIGGSNALMPLLSRAPRRHATISCYTTEDKTARHVGIHTSGVCFFQ